MEALYVPSFSRTSFLLKRQLRTERQSSSRNDRIGSSTKMAPFYIHMYDRLFYLSTVTDEID